MVETPDNVQKCEEAKPQQLAPEPRLVYPCTSRPVGTLMCTERHVCTEDTEQQAGGGCEHAGPHGACVTCSSSGGPAREANLSASPINAGRGRAPPEPLRPGRGEDVSRATPRRPPVVGVTVRRRDGLTEKQCPLCHTEVTAPSPGAVRQGLRRRGKRWLSTRVAQRRSHGKGGREGGKMASLPCHGQAWPSGVALGCGPRAWPSCVTVRRGPQAWLWQCLCPRVIVETLYQSVRGVITLCNKQPQTSMG